MTMLSAFAGGMMLRFIKSHWEQIFFGVVGLIFLSFSLAGLWSGDVAGASATFGMAFFSFLYANISRFKRFKGLGFEAELWEDKQKEAGLLIDRLKAVVSVYTREIVMGRVKEGRWGDGAGWREHWRVYHELVDGHSDLGQDIDFSDLKESMDQYFIFDMVQPLYDEIRVALLAGRGKASTAIEKEFGSPIKDSAGYSLRLKRLQAFPEKVNDLFKVAQTDDVAAVVLKWGKSVQEMLEENYSITVEFDQEVVKSLREISLLHQAGPIEVTESLLSRFDAV